MSTPEDFDVDTSQRTQAPGYTTKHPIPNIQRYHEHQKEREQKTTVQEEPQTNYGLEESKSSFLGSIKEKLKLESSRKRISGKSPYKSSNRNEKHADNEEDSESSDASTGGSPTTKKTNGSAEGSQVASTAMDPRQKRKNMKHMKRDTKGREVTDPVTHLKVFIHDQTEKDLGRLSENKDPQESTPLKNQIQHTQSAHEAMERLFPPPKLNHVEAQISRIIQVGLIVSIASLLGFTSILLALQSFGGRNQMIIFFIAAIALLLFSLIIYLTARSMMSNQISSIWKNEVWASEKRAEQSAPLSNIPESTQWLNSILNSVWALINPDLFTSLADTLEDVMQASLPKMVRMISVEDLGQGSEAIRILGVKWLPAGAAAKDVNLDGEVEPGKSKESDRTVPGQGELDLDQSRKADKDRKSSRQQGGDQGENGSDSSSGDENVAEGMEAEEGDFVNVELGFAYRASSNKGKNLKSRAKNAHLYLAFYLPGRIRFRKFPAHRVTAVLTIYSRLGRAARNRRNPKNAPAAVP